MITIPHRARPTSARAAADLAPRAPSTDWHALSVERVLALLETSDVEGLDRAEALARLDTHGHNVLAEVAGRRPWRILAGQFSDLLVLVLLGSAVLSLALGETVDAAAIGLVVTLNAMLGFIQELRAERALAALRSLAAPHARVRREGAWWTRPAADIVPGDIVALEAGDVVPADLRLVASHGLSVGESMLTGESVPVAKSTMPLDPATALPDRHNMAYKGTVVMSGRGRGAVVATGMRSELGRIAALAGAATQPRTPLQERLIRLGRALAAVVLLVCVVVLLLGVQRGEPLTLMVMTAISLAVAAIPEALPAVVTVSLALGARRMVRRNALVRSLPAVETLGAVTHICTDKTGTLTENRMRVERLLLGDGAPVGSEKCADEPAALLLEAMALANDAAMGADGVSTGDPMDVALHDAACRAGISMERLSESAPRVAELPFTADRARMTTVHERRDGGVVAYTKGAPERVIPACRDRLLAGGADAIDHAALLASAARLAAEGHRVLAVAMRRFERVPEPLELAEVEQTFLGLVGLLDPPRAEAADAVAVCRSAGIRVLMVTGDHPATARAIAVRVGIAPREAVVVTGPQLAAMSDEELDHQLREVRIFARVAPDDKIRIVRALQRAGASVAMTGDGVNDAPALRQADIGVAMGGVGTEVAREAADIVLLDDDFATIVGAVVEGRRAYDNIRRFVRYGLATNAAEIGVLVFAPLLGLPLPLLPIQILWMNLVTDGLPGLALSAEPAEPGVMARPPRPPRESLFAHGLWQQVVWVGLLMSILTLAVQHWAIAAGDVHWRSMTFTLLTFAQLAHLLTVRSEHESLLRHGFWSNPALATVLLVTAGLQMATLYVPPMQRLFGTDALSAGEVLLCLAVASVVLIAVEAEKWMVRRGALYRAGNNSPVGHPL